MAGERILLASASPRRAQLLREAGLDFEIEPSDAPEDVHPGWSPEQAAQNLAERKARAVAERHGGQALWVIGADTIVATGEGEAVQLLGKPRDPHDARAMLESLSGTRHRVVTGVAVVCCLDGGSQAAYERTWVHMRTITPEEIGAYVESGEWQDKAGGYAIQENADAFVVQLEEGGFDTVVGLPVALTLELLALAGLS